MRTLPEKHESVEEDGKNVGKDVRGNVEEAHSVLLASLLPTRRIQSPKSQSYFTPTYISDHHSNSVLSTIPNLPSQLSQKAASSVTSLLRTVLSIQSDMLAVAEEASCGDEEKARMMERLGLGERVLATCADSNVGQDMKTVALQCLLAGDV